MSTSRSYPPLKPLHPDDSLNPVKLAQLERVSTELLKQSLLPGQSDSLKARPDGTMLNGHHRIYVLRRLGMRTEVYWIDGPWSGKLGLAARPRGGDWLGDEIADWKRAGVNTVVSLLTSQEESDLLLDEEANHVRSQSMRFVSFPIPDREVPSSEQQLARTLDALHADLISGKNILVHCRQGIGRTGLVAACLLVAEGWNPETAVKRLSAIRGVSIPETPEQRRWIDHYATALTGSK